MPSHVSNQTIASHNTYMAAVICAWASMNISRYWFTAWWKIDTAVSPIFLLYCANIVISSTNHLLQSGSKPTHCRKQCTYSSSSMLFSSEQLLLLPGVASWPGFGVLCWLGSVGCTGHFHGWIWLGCTGLILVGHRSDWTGVSLGGRCRDCTGVIRCGHWQDCTGVLVGQCWWDCTSISRWVLVRFDQRLLVLFIYTVCTIVRVWQDLIPPPHPGEPARLPSSPLKPSISADKWKPKDRQANRKKQTVINPPPSLPAPEFYRHHSQREC